MQQAYAHVIWDWNGTLLDDVTWCIEVMNTMLRARGIGLLDIGAYQKAFRFPVEEYYRAVGLDFSLEPYAGLAAEFIERYQSGYRAHCKLYPDAFAVLHALQAAGFKQAILSATEQANLGGQVAHYGVDAYIDDVLGTGDIYSESKIETARAYMARHHTHDAVLIGDTVHDYEVACDIGIDCLLIASGHHDKERLQACGVPVLENLGEVPAYLV